MTKKEETMEYLDMLLETDPDNAQLKQIKKDVCLIQERTHEESGRLTDYTYLLSDCLKALSVSRETVNKLNALKDSQFYAKSLVFGEIHRIMQENARLKKENARLNKLASEQRALFR